MIDFQIYNSTKLLFRNDPSEEITNITKGKKVLFVYGGGSVHSNGCFDDVKKAVLNGKGQFFELKGISRDYADVERGIKYVKDNNIELLIGAGGASVMDAAKIIAFGACNQNYYKLIIDGENIFDLPHVPLILIPTYPSSGSEYDGSAVVDKDGSFGVAWGITANHALLVPKYSASLNAELTAYSSIVTLVQLLICAVCDKNPISYGIGISVIKNVLEAAKKLKKDPKDLNSRGVVLYGASISTAEWIGLGKTVNYSTDFYYIEMFAEIIFKTSYRKALTVLFPHILKAIAKHKEEDVRSLLKDAFGFDGTIDDSLNKVIQLFTDLGIDMYFHTKFPEEKISEFKYETVLSKDEVLTILKESTK